MAKEKGNNKNAEKKLIQYYAKLRENNTSNGGVRKETSANK